jgi:hypothetical protein
MNRVAVQIKQIIGVLQLVEVIYFTEWKVVIDHDAFSGDKWKSYCFLYGWGDINSDSILLMVEIDGMKKIFRSNQHIRQVEIATRIGFNQLKFEFAEYFLDPVCVCEAIRNERMGGNHNGNARIRLVLC